MFAQANQTHFNLSIDTIEHDLQVLEFKEREAISQPYTFDVELINEHPNLDLKNLLHQHTYRDWETDRKSVV